MNSFSMAWRLLRGGGRRGMLGSVLTLAAVALVSALLLFAVAGNLAFAERAEKTSWRLPVETTDTATAIEAASTDNAGGREFTRVDLAATGDGKAPVPPGMDHFPEPGEVWVSPALASLLDELPDSRLADRFPGEPSGVLGDAALVNDAELVAVVGHAPDDPAVTKQRHGFDVSPTPIADFDFRGVSDMHAVYQALMAVATVLMVVPLLVFGGAAARLTVARRDQRLASLRLVGATPGQVVRLTVAEAMITAFIGAVAGTGVYFAAAPALARIPIDGAGWRLSEMTPGPLWVIAVLAVIPLLVGMSAVIGLRRVVVSPLGVARRHTPPGVRAVRLLVLAACVIAFLGVAAGVFGNLGGLGAIIVLILLGGTFLSMNLVGPWVVSVIGRITAGLARRPSTLLAGRRLIDDPRSAWRTVAGVALTGFVAGFIALLAPPALGGEATTRIEITADTADREFIVNEVDRQLSVDVEEPKPGHDPDTVFLTLVAPNDFAAVDKLRTALVAEAPGADILSTGDSDADSLRTFVDIRTGILVVLSVSLLIAMVSAAIAGASAVLDRRQAYALLHLSGTPIQTLNAARRTETLIPLAIMGGGSILTGMLLATPFLSGAGLSIDGAIALAATVGLGLIGILAASGLSRPLLRSVMVNAAPRPD
ncbi:MAG: FtsX-like permease family protein [Stackebrandtia sp.]